MQVLHGGRARLHFSSLAKAGGGFTLVDLVFTEAKFTVPRHPMEPLPSGLRIVNVHQAKTHLSRLINDAHAGETILLAKAGKPWARLMPLAPPPQPRCVAEADASR